MLSAIFIFFVFLLGNKLCQADLVDDAEATLNSLRNVSVSALTLSFYEHANMTTSVNKAALDTKESSFEFISTKINEFVSELEKAKILNLAKVDICQKSPIQLTKIVADDIATCVDQQADQAITLIYDRSSTLTYVTLSMIYNQEKAIIYCGRSDTDCLNSVIEDINSKAIEISDLINQRIADNYILTDEQIELIEACKTQGKNILNNFYKKCVFKS